MGWPGEPKRHALAAKGIKTAVSHSSAPMRLIERLKKSGGFTINVLTGKTPKVGWAVAIRGAEKKVRSKKMSSLTLQRYRKKHPELERNDRYLGAWDNGRGTIFLDVVRIVHDKEMAMTAGRAAGQISIYNFKTKEVIYL